MNEIVVGLDLSPSARAALKWAAAQARATGQNLRAVHAFDTSATLTMAVGMGGLAVPVHASAMDAYREAISDVFDSVQPETGWRLEFSPGAAGPVLVAEGLGEALLVVGTREQSGIGRFVFGSVSHHCISHAQCPVVAVPALPAQRAQAQDDDQTTTHSGPHA